MKNKVVLLGVTPPPVGGIAQWTMRMLNADLGVNWEIELIDEKILGNREFFGSKNRYNYFLEVKRWSSIWRRLSKSLKDKNVRIVHACPTASLKSMLAEYVSAVIAKRNKKKLILHFRCTVPNMIDSKYKKYVLSRFCNKADLIIVLNKQTEKYIRGITKIPVILIPNFVSMDEIPEKKIESQIKVATYVGGVISDKGCDEIIRLAEFFPEIEFRLVGKATDELVSMALEVQNVKMVGVKNKSGVQEELKKADIFIFLSRFKGEGFSNALAEAMGAGLPCIVSNWAANADMIDDGKGGAVMHSSDISELKEAVQRLHNSELRKIQSEYNRHKVKSEYCEERVVKEYIRCYDSLIVEDN